MPIIIDKKMKSELIDGLKSFFPNKAIIKSYELSGLSGALSTHPDIQIHFVDYHTAVCAPECFEYYRSNLGKYGINVVCGKINPENTYPNDIAYNVARLGNYVLSNTRYTEPKILEYYKGKYKIVNTRQGYAKCSLCIAGDNAAVTEDPNLYSVLSEIDGIKVYKAEKGMILLDGYQYGFIGGASGLVDGTLVFCGSMNDDGIIEFLNDNGIKFVSISGERLTDYGSIICRR